MRATSGTVELETAKPFTGRVGFDKGFDTAEFVADMRDFNVTSYVAQNATNRHSVIDHPTTRHPGYENQSAEAQAR